MNRLARGSGLAVSALTAATATILLLLPGRAQLEYPEATVGVSGGAIVTSGATAPSGNGRRGPASASEHGQGLTVSGTGSPPRLFGAGGGSAGQRSTGAHYALSAESRQPVLASHPRQAPVIPAHRAAPLSLWLSDWTPPAGRNCSAGVCVTTEGAGQDGPHFQINGDRFDVGPVLLQIRRRDGTVLWSTTVTATSYPGFAGAALRARTPVGDCSGVPGTTKNDYVIAYDTVSGRWSGEIPLDSGCASR